MDLLPPLPASVTDPSTARMCTETGHICIACPQDVRNLFAVAHNAHGAVTAALDGTGSWEHAGRKLAELKRAIDGFREVVEGEHFEAMQAAGRL